MLVFRVEFGLSLLNENLQWCSNIGPYRAGAPENLGDDTAEWIDSLCMYPEPTLSADERRHPAPWEDSRLWKNLKALGIDFFEEEKLHFGFTSLQKLSHWFSSDDRYYLQRCGFICMVYETDTAIAGSKQCVFDIKNAIPIRFLELSKIY